MKNIITVITAAILSVSAFAADVKKEEKKPEAKPTVTAPPAKESKPAATPAPAKKEEAKK